MNFEEGLVTDLGVGQLERHQHWAGVIEMPDERGWNTFDITTPED